MTSPRCSPAKTTTHVPSSTGAMSSSAKPDVASTGISSVTVPSFRARHTSNFTGEPSGVTTSSSNCEPPTRSIVASAGAAPSATWLSTPT